jgi:vacuolar-type H+-ATPase subunit H
MAIPEIDQIKRTEQEAADLIEAAQRRKTLAIEETVREGEALVQLRLSEAETRLREEKEQAGKEAFMQQSRLIKEARKEADLIREYAQKNHTTAVQSLIRLITGG